MALDSTTNKFSTAEAAQSWFHQLRAEYVVTGTHVDRDGEGAYVATARFLVRHGAVVRVTREEHPSGGAGRFTYLT